MENQNNFFSLLEYDSLKLLNKYEKISSIFEVRDGKRTFDPLWPISVELHLTDLCNLDCYWCTDIEIRQTKATLDINIVKSLLKDFKEHDVGVTLEGGGEPSIHRNFGEIVEYAQSINLDLGLITNGTRDISKWASAFKWIRVSIDSTNSEEYIFEKRKDYFDKVIKNVKKLNESRQKDETLIGAGYVMTKHNADHIPSFIEFLDQCEVDYIYLRPVEESAEHLPDMNKLYNLHEKLKNNKDLRIKFLLKTDERTIIDNDNLPCIAHSLTCVIRANGDVVMCEKRRHDIKVFGNVNETSFNEIWLSEGRKKISKKLLNPDANKGCEVCRLTKFNRTFYDLGSLKTNKFI
jgi:radical SAM protein with 4Fe4S-binding SPASM domain